MTRHWSGPFRAHPIWHWVWLSDGLGHRHGYGPTYESAMSAAKSAPRVNNVPIAVRVERRI